MALSLDRFKGKVAVVTGASSGIGAATVEKLVEQGLKVVGLARRQERVEALAKKLSSQPGKLYAYKADISKEEDILSAFKWITENVGPVHILINNAGVGYQATLTEGSTEQWQQILNTNVLGLCIATREAVKIMKENKIDGHIIHINSILGHYIPQMPKSTIYPASKYAVTALTENLRQELNNQKLKIKVTSVSPGVVDTEIFEASGTDFKIAEMAHLQPEDIANGIVYVLSTPPHVQVHELTIKPVGETF